MKNYEKLAKHGGFYPTAKDQVYNLEEGVGKIKSFLKECEPEMVTTFEKLLAGAIEALDDGYTEVHIGGLEYYFSCKIIRIGGVTKMII